MRARYIDANALIDYANNQIDQTITANDIARFPTAIDVKWHYPSKGELPEVSKLLLIRIPGCYVLGWYRDNAWYFDRNYNFDYCESIECEIIAWQYLPEPPKEMESKKNIKEYIE